jgi:hypothetical protein
VTDGLFGLFETRAVRVILPDFPSDVRQLKHLGLFKLLNAEKR